MRYTMKNNIMSVEINSNGAEVKSVIKNGVEYMWNANPEYWGRTSPVLFPFVGSLNGGIYKVEDKEYAMGQHGFARDMEFVLTEQSDTRLVFMLSSNEETLKKYPFEFTLKITYAIMENALTVGWKVENTADKSMYFSIGAHPAFMCPLNGGNQSDYKLKFDTDKDIEYYLLDGGLIDKSKTYKLSICNGYANINAGMFDRDALIVEGRQASKISLCYPDGMEYISVKTNAPLFGLWSPAGKDAPFVCVEPWYGRGDAVGFHGDLSEREYSNNLPAGEQFSAEYAVEFN